ncbi:unnamed protein product, partial [Didymodactylos carnosus]
CDLIKQYIQDRHGQIIDVEEKPVTSLPQNEPQQNTLPLSDQQEHCSRKRTSSDYTDMDTKKDQEQTEQNNIRDSNQNEVQSTLQLFNSAFSPLKNSFDGSLPSSMQPELQSTVVNEPLGCPPSPSVTQMHKESPPTTKEQILVTSTFQPESFSSRLKPSTAIPKQQQPSTASSLQNKTLLTPVALQTQISSVEQQDLESETSISTTSNDENTASTTSEFSRSKEESTDMNDQQQEQFPNCFGKPQQQTENKSTAECLQNKVSPVSGGFSQRYIPVINNSQPVLVPMNDIKSSLTPHSRRLSVNESKTSKTDSSSSVTFSQRTVSSQKHTDQQELTNQSFSPQIPHCDVDDGSSTTLKNYSLRSTPVSGLGRGRSFQQYVQSDNHVHRSSPKDILNNELPISDVVENTARNDHSPPVQSQPAIDIYSDQSFSSQSVSTTNIQEHIQSSSSTITPSFQSETKPTNNASSPSPDVHTPPPVTTATQEESLQHGLSPISVTSPIVNNSKNNDIKKNSLSIISTVVDGNSGLSRRNQPVLRMNRSRAGGTGLSTVGRTTTPTIAKDDEQQYVSSKSTGLTTNPVSNLRSTICQLKSISDDNLCYLLGPGRESLKKIESQYGNNVEIYSHLPNGCFLAPDHLHATITQQIKTLIPEYLSIEIVKMNPNQDYELFLLLQTSHAEQILQAHQKEFAIITETFSKVEIQIEVTQSNVKNPQSSTASATCLLYPNDGKFHIQKTHSSIDVILNDISQVSADALVCITTSENILKSVLAQAGKDISDQYHQSYKSDQVLILNGGKTKAQKIIFIDWKKTTSKMSDTEIQESLATVVQFCLDTARERDIKSIVFPPIGTGSIGCDSFLVAEAMIGAASERLHKYEMNVIYAIYTKPQDKYPENDPCYQ